MVAAFMVSPAEICDGHTPATLPACRTAASGNRQHCNFRHRRQPAVVRSVAALLDGRTPAASPACRGAACGSMHRSSVRTAPAVFRCTATAPSQRPDRTQQFADAVTVREWENNAELEEAARIRAESYYEVEQEHSDSAMTTSYLLDQLAAAPVSPVLCAAAINPIAAVGL